MEHILVFLFTVLENHWEEMVVVRRTSCRESPGQVLPWDHQVQ